MPYIRGVGVKRKKEKERKRKRTKEKERKRTKDKERERDIWKERVFTVTWPRSPRS
jgi:hypothetical protein